MGNFPGQPCAKAGIQGAKATAVALDPRFREGDDTLLIILVSFRAGLFNGRLWYNEEEALGG
jgi:hypothetical protein